MNDHHGDLVDRFEHAQHGDPPILTDHGSSDTEQNAEQDEGQHVGVGGGANGIFRDHVEQQLYDRRGLAGQLDVAGGLIAVLRLQGGLRLGAQTTAGLDYIREDESDGYGHRRGGQVVPDGLSTDTAQGPQITQAGRSDNEAGNDQRDHDHADQADPSESERLNRGDEAPARLPPREVDHDAHDGACHESDSDLGIQFHGLSVLSAAPDTANPRTGM